MEYQKLKADAVLVVQGLQKRIAEQAGQIEKITKRLGDEMDNVRTFEKRIKVLKEKAGDSLLGDTNTYETFKVSLRKLTIQRDNSVEICQTFSNDLLPAKKEQLAKSRAELETALQEFCEKKAVACEAKMTELIAQAITERDDFLEAVHRLFAENGVVFKPGKAGGCIPKPQHPRIDKNRMGFAIVPLSGLQRAKRLQKNSLEKSEKQLTSP